MRILNFFRLINSAQKIHKEAELNESLGDDEKAYILYMKYFNVVTLARKLPDYKKQKVVDNLVIIYAIWFPEKS